MESTYWRVITRGMKWGAFSAVLSAIYAPVWIELNYVVSEAFFGDQLAGSLGSIIPGLWLGIFLIILIGFLIPHVIGCSILSLVIMKSASRRGLNIRYGVLIGSLIGGLLGTLTMGIGLMNFATRGINSSNIVDYTIPLVLWVIWSVGHFGFIGWRLSLSYKTTLPHDVI